MVYISDDIHVLLAGSRDRRNQLHRGIHGTLVQDPRARETSPRPAKSE